MSNISRRTFGLAMMGPLGMNHALPLRPLPLDQQSELEGGNGSITDVPGVKVGHYTDPRRPTGCTAIVFEDGATAGVDYDGSAPGEFQVVMLQPVSSLSTVWAIVLSGGDSWGLSTALGAMRYLEERGLGEHWWPDKPHMVMPIVVASILDDLGLGDSSIRPDAESGYKACKVATSGPVEEGCVGAGAGATVGTGSYCGGLGMKSGIGTASLRVEDFVIGAIMAVNATGDIVDWVQGKIIAGARREDGKGFVNISENVKKQMARQLKNKMVSEIRPAQKHTTIGVIATNAVFNKTELTRIAMLANTGAAKAINPYHTTEDGDQLYAVSTGKLKVGLNLAWVGILAAEVVAAAITRAAKMATSVEGWPAYRDFTLKLSQ